MNDLYYHYDTLEEYEYQLDVYKQLLQFANLNSEKELFQNRIEILENDIKTFKLLGENNENKN